MKFSKPSAKNFLSFKKNEITELRKVLGGIVATGPGKSSKVWTYDSYSPGDMDNDRGNPI